MKKIMIALAILGITFSGAEAQTKKQITKDIPTCPAKKKVVHKKRTTTTTYAKRYQICTDEGGYNNCCVYTKRVASVTKRR
jgi:hypothetical protein